MMYRCEICENCRRHVENMNCSKSAKNCNKRHVPALVTCARCKEVRYCSRACQKAQWKSHKSACYSHIAIMARVAASGPVVERFFKAFRKFSQNVSGYLECPAISALELHRGKERIETHVFFVTVRAQVAILWKNERGMKCRISFDIVSAESKTMGEMHELLDWRTGPSATPASTDFTLAHRPGLLRIFIHDVSGFLPPTLDGYTLPTDISNWPSFYHRSYNPDWYENLLKSVGQLEGTATEDESLDGYDYVDGPPAPLALPWVEPNRTDDINQP